MTNEDGSLVMIFNGEIYNSVELRRYCDAKGHAFRSSMDGEVILHLWEMEGPQCLRRLNGIFAVAIASTVTGEIVIARDPVGVKPLFYSVGGDQTLWFASELAALKRMGAPLGGDDPTALAQFLGFLWVPDPRTPFLGAKSLKPGQALRWGTNAMEFFYYGDRLVPTPHHRSSSSAQVIQASDQLVHAANRQLLGDVPIGLMASGGVDSGLLWWATSSSLERAYTITWEDSRDFEGLGDDHRAVLELAQRFQTPVEYLPGETAQDELPPSGDLFADPAYHLTDLIAKRASAQGFKVLLSGQGADELFGGYRRHRVAGILDRLHLGGLGPVLERVLRGFHWRQLSAEYIARIVRAGAEGNPFAAYMQLCTYSTARERARALDCDESEVANDIIWERHREVYERLPSDLSFMRKAVALDFSVYLPGLGLSYVDRAGMASGVEVRVPWLDLELVRWALCLPDSALLKRGRGKWVTETLAAKELSHRVAGRPKRGFAAPATTVRATRVEREGEQGFRQGTYFARAESILHDHLHAMARRA